MQPRLVQEVIKPDLSKGLGEISVESLARYHESVQAHFSAARTLPQSPPEMTRAALGEVAVHIARHVAERLGKFSSASAENALRMAPELREVVTIARDAMSFLYTAGASRDGLDHTGFQRTFQVNCENLQWLTGALVSLDETLRPTAQNLGDLMGATGKANQALLEFSFMNPSERSPLASSSGYIRQRE